MTASANHPLIRLLLYLALAAVMLVALAFSLVIIPVAGLLLLVVAGAVEARSWLARSHQPNGLLDERRNVHVRTPDADDPPSE